MINSSLPDLLEGFFFFISCLFASDCFAWTLFFFNFFLTFRLDLLTQSLTDKAPSLKNFAGEHLEADEYHKAMQDPETVIIDVRNAYESAIGNFQPPENGAKLIDPKMRNSIEFPKWLNSEETQKQLTGKKVLVRPILFLSRFINYNFSLASIFLQFFCILIDLFRCTVQEGSDANEPRHS